LLAPGRFVTGGRLFKASLDQGNQVGRAASGLHREHRVLHPALPRSCDRRCPGQTDRGNPAPLTSNREGAAPSWPQKPIRPLISQQPGWSLLHKRKLHPRHVTRATSEQQRGVPWIRGRARGSHSIAAVGRSRTLRSQAPRPPETTVFGETMARGGSAHQPQKGSSCCARRATRGVRSRFMPLPTAENAAGEGALPGRTLDQGPSQDRAEHVPRETRVTHGPAEALAASSNAASTDSVNAASDIERSAGCSCTWVSCRC